MHIVTRTIELPNIDTIAESESKMIKLYFTARCSIGCPQKFVEFMILNLCSEGKFRTSPTTLVSTLCTSISRCANAAYKHLLSENLIGWLTANCLL